VPNSWRAPNDLLERVAWARLISERKLSTRRDASCMNMGIKAAYYSMEVGQADRLVMFTSRLSSAYMHGV
jgi:hypothetical protein